MPCMYVFESTLRAAHDLGYDAYIIEDAVAAFTLQTKRTCIKGSCASFLGKVF